MSPQPVGSGSTGLFTEQGLFPPHGETASYKYGVSFSQNQARPEPLLLPLPITILVRVARRGREGGEKEGKKEDGGENAPTALGPLSWKGQPPGKVCLEQEGGGGIGIQWQLSLCPLG